MTIRRLSLHYRQKKRSTKNIQHQYFEQRLKVLAEKTEGRTITRVPCWRNLSKFPEHFHDHRQVVRSEFKGGRSNNPTSQEQSLDILGLELLCPKERAPTESSSENSENRVVEDREAGQGSPGKDLVATSRLASRNEKSHGGLEFLQSVASLGKSRTGMPRTTGLQRVKGYAKRQWAPERDSSTTNVLPQELLAQARQAEKSINIPRQSLSSQPPRTAAEPLPNPNHCFRVLDILTDKNEDESKQKPSTEPYAAFASKGYGRTDPPMLENLLQSAPISVRSKRARATSLSKIGTLPTVEVADQELRISQLQMQRNYSCSSPMVSNASWRLASQENPKRIASPTLDFMRMQDTIPRKPDSGNLNTSSQNGATNSPECFLETSWNVPVTANIRFISLDGLDGTDLSRCQSSAQMCPNLEGGQSWGSDFLEVDNPVHSCQFGSKASISEEPLSSFEDNIGSWDSNFREQEYPLGTFERGAKGGTIPGEGFTILEDLEFWDSDVLKQVNPAGTFEITSRSTERSGERLASFEEFSGSRSPNFLEQNDTVGTILDGSEGRVGSEDSLISFEVGGYWDSGFVMQENPIGSRKIGLADKSSFERRFESFEDDLKPWESNFLELDKPAGSCEVRSIAKTCLEESPESSADGGSSVSDFLEQNDPARNGRLGSEDRPTTEQRLRMFDHVGSWESGFLKQEHPATTRETYTEAKEERISNFGIFVVF